MQAITVNKADGALEWKAVSSPTPKSGEVLVKIFAAGVNRADILQRRGLYDPPPETSDTLGLECAGEIIGLGDSVKGWAIGDRVFALLGGGGYAELVTVPQDMLIAMPGRLSFEQAAAIPEAFYTAYLNLFVNGALCAGESVLIYSGGGGVGTAAIQLANHFGAEVFATAGDPHKMDRSRQLGARQVFNYKKEDSVNEIREATLGVNVILDTVGGRSLAGRIELLKPKGRLLLVGLLGGGRGEINLSTLLMKNISVIASTLRNKSLAEKIALTRKIKNVVMPLFEEGVLRPVVDSVYPVIQAGEAHQRMLDNQNFGKIVLKIP
jgi:putative PIG3 family NAD(P)H quinone oxidoreductase